MVSLADIVGSYTPLTRMGNEWTGKCPLESHAEPLAVIGKRVRCFGCGFDGDALQFLTAIGMDEAEAGDALSDGRIWTPTLTAPVVPPSKYALARIAGTEGRVLVLDSRKAVKVAEEQLAGQYAVLAVWPDGAARWELEPLRNRTVLLWPSQAGTADMLLLEAVLPNLGATGKIVEGVDLTTWAGTAAELVAAAHANVRPLRTAAQNSVADAVPGAEGLAGPQAGNVQRGDNPPSPTTPEAAEYVQDAPQPPQGSAEPPPPDPSDFPAGASPVRPPPRPRKPRLASVDGNLARELEADGDVLPLALSESGVAAEFVATHKGKFLVCHEWASKHGPLWLAWTGTHWKREASRVQAWQAASALGHTLKYRSEANSMTWASKHKFETKKFTAAFLDFAGYDKDLIATPELFDADPLMLGTPAGPVDLRIGKLLEPEPTQFITRQTTVAPIAGPHPLFDDVIRRASGGDDSMTAYIWRWLGLFCSGLSVKAFLFLWGKRDSGKTTLIETVAAILGKAQDGGYATTVDMEMFTESRNDKGSDRLAHLHGARLVYASETEEGRHWKASLLKLVTGKDTLEGRFLYSEKFSFKPTHKLVIFGNERPHLKQKDEGVANRMHLVEYPGVILPEEIDDKIDEKLVAEYPAILHSMIQGFLDFQMCNGLGKPEAVSNAVENYMEAEDDLGGWCDECIVRENTKTAVGVAYRNYKSWAERNGAFTVSAKRFSSEMEKRGFARLRYGGVRYLTGFSLKMNAPGEQGYQVP